MSTELVTRNPQALNAQEPDVLTLGKVFAASGYFKDARDQAQAVVKILAGRELGIPAVAAMTGIYIVKERVTLSANLLGAVIKRSGRYDYRVSKLTDELCSIAFFERRGKGDWASVGTSDFTWQDASKAGLAGGDNWKKFPRNMLFARALSNGAKWYCPDIFGGPVYTPDELGAAVDGETGEVVSSGEWSRPAPAPEPDDDDDAELAALAEPPATPPTLVDYYVALCAKALERGIAYEPLPANPTDEQIMALGAELKARLQAAASTK